MSLADELERLGKDAPTKIVQGFAWRYRGMKNKQSDVFAQGIGKTATFVNEEDARLYGHVINNLPAIIEALRAQEWQPIETAPRDGTRFILASTVVHEQPVVWHFNAARNAWVNDRGHYRPADDMDPEVAPVWRPLPNPPAQEQKP